MEHRAWVYVLPTRGLLGAGTAAADDRGEAPVFTDSVLSNLLTPAELVRADGFRRAVDRRAFLLAHALLRIAAAHHLGVPPTTLVFDFTCDRCGEQHGRPRLLPGPGATPVSAPALSVSLSRTAEATAVAVLAVPENSGAQVGVDLEPLSAVAFDGFDRVALSAAERLALEPNDLSARAALWVRKEAVAKALGTGLRRDPREIAVGSPEIEPGVRWADVPLDESTGLPQDGGPYAAAVATAGHPVRGSLTVTVVPATQLFVAALTPSGSPPPPSSPARSSRQRARGR